MQVDKCERVEETFESEYTFPSKVLSYLRHNDKIRRFCVKIFTKPLEELEAIEEELIVDFVMIYEKWSEIIFDNQGLLQDFMKGKFDNKPSEVKRLRAEIEVFYGKLKSDDEASILLEEMNHFSKRTCISI